MNILFTICGRKGSKGIKNKNIKEFLGKPLPLYTMSAIDIFLKDNSEIDYTIAVNTDSEELVRLLKQSLLRDFVFLRRKESLSGDSITKMAVIKDSLISMEEMGKKYDMVIDLDITSPIRETNNLKEVFDKKKEPQYDVIFTVAEARRNPYFNMVQKNSKGFYEKVIKSDYVTRQQAPEIFDMNASIYAYDPYFLKRSSNIFEGNCGIVKMRDTGILDLDDENDFILMEAIANYLVKNENEFQKIYMNII